MGYVREGRAYDICQGGRGAGGTGIVTSIMTLLLTIVTTLTTMRYVLFCETPSRQSVLAGKAFIKPLSTLLVPN